MADDDYDDDYGDDYYHHDDMYDDFFFDDDFAEYAPQTRETGPWLVVGTLLISLVIILCCMPAAVAATKRRKKEQKELAKRESDLVQEDDSFVRMDDSVTKQQAPSPYPKTRDEKPSFKTVVRYDNETRRILRYAVPFTFSAIVSSVAESAILAIIGHFVGTKQMAAYAITEILVELTEEILNGPVEALTALCAHAIGASNDFLAGQYLQLSIIFYILMQIPVILVWFFYTYDIFIFLGWGDEVVADFAHDFIRIYIWAVVLDTIHVAFENLLEVAGHEVYTTVVEFFKVLSDVAILLILALTGVSLSINLIAFVTLCTSFLFLMILTGIAYCNGWLQPFLPGIFNSLSVENAHAVKNMLMIAPPLAIGSVLENAEWAILAVFAAYLGPAEVAAWAVIGSLWDIFESTTDGIGDAAEVRVAYHLGNNKPNKAKLSAYKSLILGLLLAAAVTTFMLATMRYIPVFFTHDETLQEMIAKCLPLMAIGNLLMSFGMLCWYMVGAQGRFKLATIIMFLTSWGVTMPIAAISVYVLKLDLQALTGSLVIGYVGVGASLAYVLLTSEWEALAVKIQERNIEEIENERTDSLDKPPEADKKEERQQQEKEDEKKFALVHCKRSRTARHVAAGQVDVLKIPGGTVLVDDIGILDRGRISHVSDTTRLCKKLRPGDRILSIDGVDISNMSAEEIAQVMETPTVMRQAKQDLPAPSNIAKFFQRFKKKSEIEPVLSQPNHERHLVAMTLIPIVYQDLDGSFESPLCGDIHSTDSSEHEFT